MNAWFRQRLSSYLEICDLKPHLPIDQNPSSSGDVGSDTTQLALECHLFTCSDKGEHGL